MFKAVFIKSILFFLVFPLLFLTSLVCTSALADGGQKEFQANVFGRWVTVKPGNPRSVTAWDLGVDISEPPPAGHEIIPLGDLYLWRHPDALSLFRAQLSGVYDDVFWARRVEGLGPFETVLTFTNFSPPIARSELVDGEELKSEELLWGYVRPGFGMGYRKQVYPGNQDNMFAADLILEPGFLFFESGSETARNFIVPQDTFEFRAHLEVRWDALNRNLIKLPLSGYAAGSDIVYGYRANWRDWGINGGQAADEGREYASFTGYFLAAGRAPWLNSNHYRCIGALYGGSGYHLDRFSAFRVGGGPNPLGEEYGSTYRPVLPGSAIREFFSDHYLIMTGEFRWDPLFFASLGLDASAGWLDRLRGTGTGVVQRNHVLPAVGIRLTTGFFFNTRLQVAYNYNFGVVRHKSYGGHEITVLFSGKL